MKQKVVFMFSGQGSHYFHKGKNLYHTSPTFKRDGLSRPLRIEAEKVFNFRVFVQS
ncbi:hypothetical protein S100072_01308 [Bacillus velezensis]|nr:hypothetical protein S100072_01308 [Bacillus velezensis]